MEQYARILKLIDEETLKKIQDKKIIIVGVGGVGGFALEALTRFGIKNITIIDNDTVDITNLNRQIIATTKTIGQYKVDLMKQRILDINPEAKIETYKTFYMPDCNEEILDSSVSYVVDAIDTVTAKIFLIEEATRLNIPVISSMGTGNKLDPSKFEITDIYKTSVCPLAKVMRKELRQRNIKKLNVLYSKEEPVKPRKESEEKTAKRQVPGSIAFSPSVAGLMIASKVVKDLINI